MRKKTADLLAVAASLLLIFAILFTAIQVVINSDFIIEGEYDRLKLGNAMGISDRDLAKGCKHLIDYMEGGAESIDIIVNINGSPTLLFDNPQEVSHMADVRLLYQSIRTYRDYAVFGALVLYLLSAVLHINRAAHTICLGYSVGALIFGCAAGFIGTWGVLDFTTFWTTFHEIFFWNDDWLFDTATSRMINMMPERFFSDMLLFIVIPAIFVIVVLVILALMGLSSIRKKQEADRARRAARRQKAREEYEAKKNKKSGPEVDLADVRTTIPLKKKQHAKLPLPEEDEEEDAEEEAPRHAKKAKAKAKAPVEEPEDEELDEESEDEGLDEEELEDEDLDEDDLDEDDYDDGEREEEE